MRRHGVCILPSGDYGFAKTWHGTLTRDQRPFVERIDTRHRSPAVPPDASDTGTES